MSYEEHTMIKILTDISDSLRCIHTSLTSIEESLNKIAFDKENE